jgi:regulator of replication initiation timing
MEDILEEMVKRIEELESENTRLSEENIELARENRELRTIVGYHLTSNRSV